VLVELDSPAAAARIATIAADDLLEYPLMLTEYGKSYILPHRRMRQQRPQQQRPQQHAAAAAVCRV
jgi:hypothetical protein